ncbi:hypothetical protein [Streptomyces sp. NPDC003456]|uniref:hypothetical protein n=1 Tax=Streptomyces sp. NPDC003456 TaxID=3364683 RepID=UPI0036CB9D1B
MTHENERRPWHVADHRGVSPVPSEPAAHPSGKAPAAPTRQNAAALAQGGFLAENPPEHRRPRTLVSRASTLARRLPLMVVAGLLGLPAEGHKLLQRCTATLCGGTQPGTGLDRSGLARADRAPSRFTSPDVTDPARGPEPRRTSGRGIHCGLGALPARLEARVAPPTTRERFSDALVPSYDAVHRKPAVAVGTRPLPLAVTRP